MDFSIIIPVLNERSKIVSDIQGVDEYLKTRFKQSELIIVDDGSSDGSSETAQRTKTSAQVELRVITHERRKGKGHAVRTGMTASTGHRIMFADSGSCVPWTSIDTGLSLIDSGAYQIANASRKLPESKIIRPQPLNRRLNSALFRIFLILFLGVPKRFTDTQCGFKLYDGNAGRELFAACITDGFTFDVEVLLRALKSGHDVTEFPIEWTADPDSRLSQTLSVKEILTELKKIKKALN
jgi:dolichyl-phosphate beta-glucosyltransferase